MNTPTNSGCSFGPDSSDLLHPSDLTVSSRREFLTRNGIGFGGLSLAALFGLNPFDVEAAANGAPMGPLAPQNRAFSRQG